MPQDSGKVFYLLEAAHLFTDKAGEYDSDLDSALLFAAEAEKLSDALGLEGYSLKSQFWRGAVFLERRQWEEGRKLLHQVSIGYSNLEDKFNQGLSLHRLANFLPRTTEELVFEKLELLNKAAQLFLESDYKEKYWETTVDIAEIQLLSGESSLALLSITEALEGLLSIESANAMAAYQIAIDVQEYYGNFDKALAYSFSALELIEKKNLDNWRYFIYDKLGDVSLAVGEFQQASDWYKLRMEEAKLFYPNYVFYDFHEMILPMVNEGAEDQALQLIRTTLDQFPVSDLYYKKIVAFCFALCYEKRGDFELAERNYLKSVSVEDTALVDFTFHNYVSEFFFTRNLYEKSKVYANQILDATGVKLQVRSRAFHNLYRADSALGNYFTALTHQRQFLELQKEITDEAKLRQVELLSIEYETEKKDREIELKNNSIELLSKQSLAQKRLQRATLVGIVLVIIILVLVFTQYRIKQKSNQKLLLRQQEIDKTNAELQHLLIEKEWLLKEVHHRVKNNLQTVLSLLESQSRNLSEEAVMAISDIKGRVFTMSLIHKKLYQSEDVAAINIRDYLSDLAIHLKESFGHTMAQINFDVDPIIMDLSQVVPVGLIINEAITNSFKHAFINSSIGNEIHIELKKEAGTEIKLTIQDNGIGFDFETCNKGLGLKLIQGLTEDLEGSLSISSKKGMGIYIKFPLTLPFQNLNDLDIGISA